MSLNNNNTEPEWVLRKSMDTMEKIIEISQALVEAHDLETIMKIVRTGTRELTGSDGATFVLKEGDYCHYADEDAIQPLWKGQRFPIDECVSGWAMMNHQVAIVSDIFTDEEFKVCRKCDKESN